jgi:hypothetical protein
MSGQVVIDNLQFYMGFRQQHKTPRSSGYSLTALDPIEQSMQFQASTHKGLRGFNKLQIAEKHNLIQTSLNMAGAMP